MAIGYYEDVMVDEDEGFVFDTKIFKLGIPIIVNYTQSSFINVINFIIEVFLICHPN